MNWKNVCLEAGFVKQEISFNGVKVVNYIPLEQVDSFGVKSSENKRWLYAGAFILLCALIIASSSEAKTSLIFWLGGFASIACYFLTRKTYFTITSNQTKFSVELRTTPEELVGVNLFIDKIKEKIHADEIMEFKQSA